jgi:hypothetical protein
MPLFFSMRSEDDTSRGGFLSRGRRSTLPSPSGQYFDLIAPWPARDEAGRPRRSAGRLGISRPAARPAARSCRVVAGPGLRCQRPAHGHPRDDVVCDARRRSCLQRRQLLVEPRAGFPARVSEPAPHGFQAQRSTDPADDEEHTRSDDRDPIAEVTVVATGFRGTDPIIGGRPMRLQMHAHPGAPDAPRALVTIPNLMVGRRSGRVPPTCCQARSGPSPNRRNGGRFAPARPAHRHRLLGILPAAADGCPRSATLHHAALPSRAPVTGHGTSTAAPDRRPSRRSASARLASASG